MAKDSATRANVISLHSTSGSGDGVNVVVGGHVSGKAKAEELSVASTAIVPNMTETISEASSQATSRSGIDDAHVPWDRLKFAKQLRLHRQSAHSASDIVLADAFLRQSKVQEIGDDSVKLVLKTIKFLHLCDYSLEDICVILAHASRYSSDAWKLCASSMDSVEVGYILAMLTFIAHCFVQDETCPLSIWHKHLFHKYCSLKTLNAAVMKAMQLRRYTLRITSRDLAQRQAHFYQALDLDGLGGGVAPSMQASAVVNSSAAQTTTARTLRRDSGPGPLVEKL